MSIIPSKKNSGGIFFDEIHDTEYRIPAEFRKNSVSTEYGIPQYEIPQYGIPYSAEFRKNTEFRNIRNSVKNTEFRNLIPAEFREQNSAKFRRNSVTRNFAGHSSTG